MPRQARSTAACYALSVWLAVALLWVALETPKHLPALYSALLVLLMAYRFWDYHGKAWHHYMIDFCYYGNALLLVALWLVPDERLFLIAFSNCCGAMVWGAILFKNTLAFHSLDKMTSCYIHIVPAMVVFSLRWQRDAEGDCFGAGCERYEGWTWQVAAPVALAALHGLLYAIWVRLVRHPKLHAQEGYANSFVYLSASFGKMLGHWPLMQWYLALPSRRRFAVFSLTQICFTGLCTLPALLMYTVREVHLAVLVCTGVYCTWFGGTFVAYTSRPASVVPSAPAPAGAAAPAAPATPLQEP